MKDTRNSDADENQSLNIADSSGLRSKFRSLLASHGTMTALRTRDRIVTYQELIAQADELSTRLGDTPQLVFLEAHASIEMVSAYVGCLIGGHPVHLYSPANSGKIDPLIETYQPNVIVHGDQAVLTWNHKNRIAVHENLSMLMGTSGTTGDSKFVKLSLANILSNADSIVEYLDITSDDIAFQCLPLYYSFGISVLNSHLVAGGSFYLSDMSPLDQGFWNEFKNAGATSFSGVPYTFQALGHAGVRFGDFPALRYVTQAGGKLSPDTVERLAIEARRDGWQFFVMYGQTEASPRIAYLPHHLAADFPDCIGIAVPGGELKLLDSAGREIMEADTEGELAYTGPNVMMGYAVGVGDLATDETPSVLLTGDLGCRNREGLYYVTGRSKRIVKPFGIRISLDGLEAELSHITAQVACMAHGETIVIAVTGADWHRSDDILDWATSRYSLPKSTFSIMHVVAIPLLDNGKPDRRGLEQLWSHRRHAPHLSARDRMSLFFRTVAPLSLGKQALVEARALLGTEKAAWESVTQIYRTILAGRHISPEDSFQSLAGDSLSYVQAFVALEDYLGEVPEEWPTMSIRELEEQYRA